MRMVRFSELAGVPVHWQRWGSTGSRKIDPCFLAELSCAMDALWRACPWGRAKAVLSHGAYVNKPGWHGVGQALDLTGIRWRGQPDFVCGSTNIKEDWMRYIGIEATLRRFIPQVLGWYESSGRHRHHWHLDARPVQGFQATSRTDVTFAQDALDRVWGQRLEVDGVWGRKSRGAMAFVMHELNIEDFTYESSWEEFLKRTAERAFSMHNGPCGPLDCGLTSVA